MAETNDKILKIDAKLTGRGISISVEGKEYEIGYPINIWRKTPATIKQIMLENLGFGETHFLPLILDKEKIIYNFNYPVGESSLFKCQLYDLIDCERDDKVEHLSYVKKFYNLEFEYKSLASTFPKGAYDFDKSKIRAIIPFSFGKESLTTFAACLELGIEPILVYCQEPVQPFEEEYKLKKLAAIQKEFKIKAYYIKHEPGLFRYGKAFHGEKKTEVGWGTQTNLLSLLVLPFVFAHHASYIFFGSEYLNNDFRFYKGWKVFLSADQTSSMSPLKDNLIRVITENQCQVKSVLEPLEEVSVFYILHHRYPKIGKYQFSCCAEEPLYEDSQWCHQCYKCARMFLFSKFCSIDPASIGFKKDLFNETSIFDYYFDKDIHKRSSSQEFDLAFYNLYKRGLLGKYQDRFKKTKIAQLEPQEWYRNFFFNLKEAPNLPATYKDGLIKIFSEELESFAKAIYI